MGIIGLTATSMSICDGTEEGYLKDEKFDVLDSGIDDTVNSNAPTEISLDDFLSPDRERARLIYCSPEKEDEFVQKVKEIRGKDAIVNCKEF